MYALCIMASMLALALAVPLQFDQIDSTWETYKKSFGRNYVGETDKSRKMIFMQNYVRIIKHNAEADMGLHSYWQGVNRFTDMTNEEFRAKMNGLKLKPNHVRNGTTFMAPLNFGAPPTTVDWRTKGYVTPVKDQGQCGSCWAFSATGSLEGQHFRKTGKLVSLSEQNLVDCSGAEGNEGCNGGLMDDAFKYITLNHGIDTEECYPYKAEDDDCTFKTACIGATDTGFVDIPSGDEQALLAAAATVGPISVAIDASNPSFQSYSSGIYDEPACSTTQLDHGVLVVGYGSHVGANGAQKDYWLVKNSWADTWGIHGYIKMSRNNNNQCGIATMSSYPLV